MKHVLPFLLVFLCLAGPAAAGDIWTAMAGPSGDIKLPSGRILKNAQSGPLVFTSGAPSALALKYETSEDIHSKEAVSKEVADVWTVFRLEAEKGNYTSAIIMVNGPAEGTSAFVKHRQQRNFVFTLKDGKWQLLLPSIWQDKKEPPKPTPTPPA